MIKKILFSIFFVLSLNISAYVHAQPLNLNQILQSVCKVNASGSYGTGTCVGEDATNYFVLTNGHVVSRARNKNVYLNFYRSGYKTGDIPAKVVWSAYKPRTDVDFAIIAVEKRWFGSHSPRIIPLAPPAYKIKSGYYIAGAGCPSSRWAQGWEGHITKLEKRRVIFTPTPVGGQSGTGIMVLVQDKNGQWHTRLGAILTWRIGNATIDSLAVGGAIPISKFYEVAFGNVNYNTIPVYYHPISYALGSDNKLYKVYIDATGKKSVNLPYNVSVLSWDYRNNGFFDNWRPGPLPRPNPSPNPKTPEPGNPYGKTPPSIGAPWPGSQNGNGNGNSQDNDTPSDKLDELQMENAQLRSQISSLEQQLSNTNKVTETETTEKTGFFTNLRNRLSNFAGGLATGMGIILLGVIWQVFLKKRIVKRVDSLQDYIEHRVTKQFGKEYGKEAREMMEGVEEAVMGILDAVFQNLRSDKKVLKTTTKKELNNTLRNGILSRLNPESKVKSSDIKSAAKQAMKETGGDPEKVAKRLDEIINDMENEKE